MNRKEVSEIKRVVKIDNPFCVLNKLYITMVNADGDLVFAVNPSVYTLTEREQNMYYDIFRNMLSTNVGKKFIQYDFENAAFEPNGAQNIMLTNIQQGFNNVDFRTALIDKIADNLNYSGPYAIVTGYFTYTVRRKNKADEEDRYTEDEFKFMLTAICPAQIVDSGFSYNYATMEFSTESDPKLYINSKPTDGFMFPAFDNRASDVSSVMYYSKSPKTFNDSIILDVLQAKFELSPTAQTEIFQKLLQDTFGERLDYQLLYHINSYIQEYVENFAGDTKPTMLGVGELTSIIRDLFEDGEEEKFETLYKAYCDKVEFDSVDLISKKMKLQTSEYSLSFNCINGSKVTAKVVDSMRAIQLTTEDNLLDVNGVVVSMK